MAENNGAAQYRIARAAGALLSPANARGRLVVFCYHQVLTASDPLRPGEPDAAQFRSDVRIIDRVFNVLKFSEAVERLVAGTLPRRAACITFDDGYADNFELAAPILESLGVPATFFIAGGAVDTGVMWNDLVIESVAHSGSAERQQGLRAELNRIKYLPLDERWQESLRLYEESVGGDLPRLMMTRDMVAGLARRGFEIAGHTINHPILKGLPDADARREIEDCAAWIREVADVEPKTFAYPNGVPGPDFDPRHEAMVRDAGFAAAASTCWAVARPDANPFAIPRIGPWWRLGRSLTSGLCRSYLKSWLG